MPLVMRECSPADASVVAQERWRFDRVMGLCDRFAGAFDGPVEFALVVLLRQSAKEKRYGYRVAYDVFWAHEQRRSRTTRTSGRSSGKSSSNLASFIRALAQPCAGCGERSSCAPPCAVNAILLGDVDGGWRLLADDVFSVSDAGTGAKFDDFDRMRRSLREDYLRPLSRVHRDGALDPDWLNMGSEVPCKTNKHQVLGMYDAFIKGHGRFLPRLRKLFVKRATTRMTSAASSPSRTSAAAPSRTSAASRPTNVNASRPSSAPPTRRVSVVDRLKQAWRELPSASPGRLHMQSGTRM